MLDLDDLGMIPRQPKSRPVPESGFEPWSLPGGSPSAQALASVWSGQPVTVLRAPPGSGKTHTTVGLLTHLLPRLGLSVRIGCPTRTQAYALLDRLVPALPNGHVRSLMRPKSPDEMKVSDLVLKHRPGSPHPGSVSVGTLSGMSMPSSAGGSGFVDLMIVDEAYQATFADVVSAVGDCRQLLLVGDPGQIGPVLTMNTAAWEGLRNAPHRRAPEVFSAREDAVTLHLRSTYRLGPITTGAIAPLYDFDFDSVRPERSIANLPEVSSLALGQVDSIDDADMLAAVARRAAELVGLPFTDEHESGTLAQADIAVVAARNSQVGVLRAMLHRDAPRITVGTADKLQGGEWRAVVAVDPFAGNTESSGHASSVGRLCVMASRHSIHLTWCFAGDWKDRVDAAEMSIADRLASIRVRTILTSQPEA